MKPPNSFSTTQRKWEKNEITLGITGEYGETKVDVTDPVTEDTDEEKMALRVVAQNTYRSEPAPGRDENDFRLLAGLTDKF